jgi:hypothetical protein
MVWKLVRVFLRFIKLMPNKQTRRDIATSAPYAFTLKDRERMPLDQHSVLEEMAMRNRLIEGATDVLQAIAKDNSPKKRTEILDGSQ